MNITPCEIIDVGYRHAAATACAPGGALQRTTLVGLAAGMGQIFVALTFGVLFAGTYSAALTALIERIGSLISLFF